MTKKHKLRNDEKKKIWMKITTVFDFATAWFYSLLLINKFKFLVCFNSSTIMKIYTTLHGYSCINQLLDTLTTYIEKVSRLAWKLSNQIPPYYLDSDFTLSTINQKKHARTSRSNQNSTTIQQFLWPALLRDNKCVSKAIVVT